MNKTSPCNSETCKYHLMTETLVGELKAAVDKLIIGQEQTRETVIQLVEAFKAVDKLENRINDLEKEQKDKDKVQDSKIDQLRAFMWKVNGSVGLGLFFTSIVLFVIKVVYIGG